jgi:hypothetical protein
MADPCDLALDPSNLKLPRRTTIEVPFYSWELCHLLLLTVSGRRHRRRPHAYK